MYVEVEAVVLVAAFGIYSATKPSVQPRGAALLVPILLPPVDVNGCTSVVYKTEDRSAHNAHPPNEEVFLPSFEPELPKDFGRVSTT